MGPTFPTPPASLRERCCLKGTAIPLQPDHTDVRAYDKVKSAEFIARMFGLKNEGPWEHFAPVKVNDILALGFDGSDNPRSDHSAFLASGDEFDATLQWIKDGGRLLELAAPADGRGVQPTAPSAWVLLLVPERSLLGGCRAHLYH